MNEESLFAAALERRSEPDRRAYLSDVCGGDAALQKRIVDLLAAHERAAGLLDHLPNANDPTLDSGRPGMAAGSPVAVGTVIAGRYRLLELIGEGGMGDVFVAEQTAPVRRKVALKLIKSGLDSRNVLARFEQERQALAVMDHPNIAKVFDGGVTVSTWLAIRAMQAERLATENKDRAIAERDEKERARNEAVASENRARKAEQAERQAKEAETEARQRAESAEQTARADLAKFELINQFLTRPSRRH